MFALAFLLFMMLATLLNAALLSAMLLLISGRRPQLVSLSYQGTHIHCPLELQGRCHLLTLSLLSVVAADAAFFVSLWLSFLSSHVLYF